MQNLVILFEIGELFLLISVVPVQCWKVSLTTFAIEVSISETRSSA